MPTAEPSSAPGSVRSNAVGPLSGTHELPSLYSTRETAKRTSRVRRSSGDGLSGLNILQKWVTAMLGPCVDFVKSSNELYVRMGMPVENVPSTSNGTTCIGPVSPINVKEKRTCVAVLGAL